VSTFFTSCPSLLCYYPSFPPHKKKKKKEKIREKDWKSTPLYTYPRILPSLLSHGSTLYGAKFKVAKPKGWKLISLLLPALVNSKD